MDVGHGTSSEVQEPTALRFKTGVMIAAVFAAWMGLMALAIANIASDVSTDFSNSLKLNAGIGPYSGKEVIWLTVWFVAWPVLHFVLRNRDMDLRKWFGVFLVGMLVAVLLMWPPFFEAIADMIKG